MRRILLLLVPLIAFTGCHEPWRVFRDGSYYHWIADHDDPDYNGSHAIIVGCLSYNRATAGNGSAADDCTVNQDTDAMTGTACAWHPDGHAGCKGIWGEPNDGANWSYGVNYATGDAYYWSKWGGGHTQCMDQYPYGTPQWSC